MAIIITDMTVCDGGNHVTLYVSEDGGEPRPIAVDFDRLSPDQGLADVAKFMSSFVDDRPEDVEPLYRAILIIRNAPAYSFADMRAAVLSAYGSAP